MRKTGIFIPLFLLLLGIANCEKEGNGPAEVTKEGVAAPSEQTALKQQTDDGQAAKGETKGAGTPRIVFDQKDFDFGKVESGEKVENIYKFRNTGDGTLVINKVRSS